MTILSDNVLSGEKKSEDNFNVVNCQGEIFFLE